MSSSEAALGLRCHACNKIDLAMSRCGRCRQVCYCSKECQVKNWQTHKVLCRTLAKSRPAADDDFHWQEDIENPWYASIIAKPLQDGTHHEGRLELITWDSADEDLELGFAAVIKDEEADMRRRFKEKYGEDLMKFYKYWPQGFRWTCCGGRGDMDFGCDHHGRGSKPCRCDFCQMGKPLPLKVYKDLCNGPGGMGLRLPRGPDKRSYNPAQAAISTMARKMLGMVME